jgi:hypothetical protein
MHEREKLGEARYFLGRLRQAQDTHDAVAFKSDLSAFLSAGRSVLQYAHKEAKAKGRQQWYDAMVGSDPCIAYLSEERNANIHDKPVSPARSTSVDIRATIRPRGSLTAVARDSKGNIKAERHADDHADSPLPEKSVVMTTSFFFSRWTGPDDVVTLAGRYLQSLERLVADGVTQGVLTL